MLVRKRALITCRDVTELKAFRERTLATLEDNTNKDLALRQAQDTKAAEDLAVLREWRAAYWRDNAGGALHEAEALIDDSLAKRRQLQRELLAFDDAERAERDIHRTFDQVGR